MNKRIPSLDDFVNENNSLVVKSQYTHGKNKAKYFFTVDISIPKGFYYNPDDVVRAQFMLDPDNFLYYEVIKDDENSKDHVYIAKVYTNKRKEELQKFFDMNTLRSENYKIR